MSDIIDLRDIKRASPAGWTRCATPRVAREKTLPARETKLGVLRSNVALSAWRVHRRWFSLYVVSWVIKNVDEFFSLSCRDHGYCCASNTCPHSGHVARHAIAAYRRSVSACTASASARSCFCSFAWVIAARRSSSACLSSRWY